MGDKHRHELKYICSEIEVEITKARLNGLVPLDSHANGGSYCIRSLYFDDYYNTCFFENESGTDPREKFRIRIYNANDSKISLELKRKQQQKTLKKSCKITKEQCETLMRGQALPIGKEYPDILNKLNLLIRTKMMKPVIIVEYERTPYVCTEGNVRVTIDRNISSSSDISRFLEPVINKRPIMPVGQHVLEVKYDEFIPDYISNNLELGTLRQTAFSKYYLCRKYA